MDFRPEMMFRMKAVVEPRPVIQLAVSAHAPGNRLVGITSIMPVVSVQIREAMAKIPKRQKETDVMPVQNPKNHKGRDEAHQLKYPPKRLARIFAFQFPLNSLWIFSKQTYERVFQWMLGFTILAVLVNRNPINGIALLVRPVGVSLVVLHVDALVKDLPEANRDRFHDAE